MGKIWPTAHVYKQNFIRTPPPASIHVLSEAVLHFNAKLGNYERNCLPLKVKNIFLPGPLKKKRKIIDLRYKPRAGSLSDCVLRSLSHSFLVMGGKKKKIEAHRQWSEEAFQNSLKWEGLIGDGGNYSRGLQSLCCTSFLVYIGVNKEAKMVCVQPMNREKRERVLNKYC